MSTHKVSLASSPTTCFFTKASRCSPFPSSGGQTCLAMGYARLQHS